MKRIPRDSAFLATVILLLFVGVASLSFLLFAGESRRARLLTEYEADRAASALLDAFRSGGEVDPSGFDARILGFGIYPSSGAAAVRSGDAPEVLAASTYQARFTYDARRKTLALVTPLGMGGAGMEGMMGPRTGRGARGRAAGAAGGAVYLSMDIADYYADMLLYRAASILAPIFAAGLTALFLVLSAGNRRYRRRAEERENLARLGEIARTLAHEIRNPLSAMRIQTGLLRRDLPGGKSRELDVMEEEIERLTLLSRRVGDFLKNPAGAPEPLDVARFVRDLAGRLPWPVDLGECANPAEPVLVSFDRDLLRSVIENLARNARESYAETGGATGKRVEICLSVDDSRVTFSVRDRGRGIPPELAEKVFDPFFTDKLHGSGVGLSLSRRFVEAAGGSLVLVPREGGGTEARVVLPRAGK